MENFSDLRDGLSSLEDRFESLERPTEVFGMAELSRWVTELDLFL
jgi:hypothetical protein